MLGGLQSALAGLVGRSETWVSPRLRLAEILLRAPPGCFDFALGSAVRCFSLKPWVSTRLRLAVDGMSKYSAFGSSNSIRSNSISHFFI